MDSGSIDRVEKFLARWEGSQGNERANYQMFFSEFCDVLDVERPDSKGSVLGDRYCFDKDVKIVHPSGKYSSGFIDFYKEKHFVIEAKQGGNESGKGTAKRGTKSYRKAMKEAYYTQGISYARSLFVKPPFIIICDIGSHFEIWQGFSESWVGATGDYGDYDAKREIKLSELRKPEVFDFFVTLFTDPQQLNPEKIAAKVTREVAEDLAELAKTLEKNSDPETVAHFLMRCIFTMFAEDVGFLKEHLFTEALEQRWIPKPKSFKPEVEALWEAMNEGGSFGYHGKLLRFNGHLFANAEAFDLQQAQLKILLQAAKRDWHHVEPAIFGTLLERALDKQERGKLGAHYTPRSYVERLVRPVVIEPLQEQWQLVKGEVELLLDSGDKKPTKSKLNKAKKILEDFLEYLRTIKILDPACGSGNFLYVTLDLMKSLESEVFLYLGEMLGGEQLVLDFAQIDPSQFFGIEINPRATAIADLVIWIGHLQWHYRRFGNVNPIEPVLQAYNNIECRDAVLEYDGKEPAIDKDTGKVRTRWGGKKTIHPVTGQAVPDPNNQITIYNYINPRPAVWQEADYIVSNPPFIGNARMRERLGDGYTETLRQVYPDVPDTVDFVMYWWHKSAQLVREEKVSRFGLITTNSIRQVRQRKVIDFHLQQKKNPIRIFFAIPDHPWDDKGAAVRVSMTACEINYSQSNLLLSRLETVTDESENNNFEDKVTLIKLEAKKRVQIFSDLSFGVDLSKSKVLLANSNLCSRGFELGGRGFIVDRELANQWIKSNYNLTKYVKPHLGGKELVTKPKNKYVIDFYDLNEKQASYLSEPFQYLLDRVKPVRKINQEEARQKQWWLFRRSGSLIRPVLEKINRFIVTVHTAKHRVFVFLNNNVTPDATLVIFGFDDAYYLGVLSSIIHITWSFSTGGRLEDRPRYNNTLCFNPFPFPIPTEKQKQAIRELGERLDSHRKRVQEKHPDITITGMYNLLEKIRNNQPLTDLDKEYNNRALVSTLKQIHDELDAAVFEAYGWTKNLTDAEILENLVKLNAQRAEEERNGLIRWLRPEYQAPEETIKETVIKEIAVSETKTITPVEQQKWAKTFKEQLAAIRNLLRTQGGEWTEAQISAQFKGRKKTGAVANCLEILQGLGLVISHSEDNITRWYAAELQQTG